MIHVHNILPIQFKRLALELGAGRTIRSMYQHMAVQAGTRSKLSPRVLRYRRIVKTADTQRIAAHQIGGTVDSAGVIAAMAFLAQVWRASFQQRRFGRTVRCMAVGAIVKHGAMLPQERAAFLGVAGVTGFVDRVLDQQFRTRRTVRIVAIGTDHLARIDRVRGNFVGIRTLLLMAGKTNLGLRSLVAHLVYRRVHLVAVIAGQLVALVLTTIPVGAIISFVASQALTGSGIAVRYREGALKK
jgi:hypothetical protein